MTETTKIFWKYLAAPKYKQHLRPLAYFSPTRFALRGQTGYFQKVLVIFVISSNLKSSFCFLPFSFLTKIEKGKNNNNKAISNDQTYNLPLIAYN